MREFISDLKYMCSADNQSSRGFYIFITVLLILIPVAAIVDIIWKAIVGFAVVDIIILIAAVAIEIGVIFWLKKS